MREIKFRGFSRRINKIIDLGPLSVLATDITPSEGIFLPFCKDVILMQYTGLKDKNGVNIYEGDILEVTWHFKVNNPVVEFYNAQFKCGAFPLCELDSKKIRVIGNIYENPEFLQESENERN